MANNPYYQTTTLAQIRRCDRSKLRKIRGENLALQSVPKTAGLGSWLELTESQQRQQNVLRSGYPPDAIWRRSRPTVFNRRRWHRRGTNSGRNAVTTHRARWCATTIGQGNHILTKSAKKVYTSQQVASVVSSRTLNRGILAF